jgi:hypothetical protein
MEEMSVMGKEKLVPSTWNIPMQDAGRMCRIWTLIKMFPLGTRWGQF